MRLTFALDLFHILEKLQDALKEMMPDDAERKATLKRMKGLIKAGNAALAVEELAPHRRRCAAPQRLHAPLPIEPLQDAVGRFLIGPKWQSLAKNQAILRATINFKCKTHRALAHE